MFKHNPTKFLQQFIITDKTQIHHCNSSQTICGSGTSSTGGEGCSTDQKSDSMFLGCTEHGANRLFRIKQDQQRSVLYNITGTSESDY